MCTDDLSMVMEATEMEPLLVPQWFAAAAEFSVVSRSVSNTFVD